MSDLRRCVESGSVVITEMRELYEQAQHDHNSAVIALLLAETAERRRDDADRPAGVGIYHDEDLDELSVATFDARMDPGFGDLTLASRATELGAAHLELFDCRPASSRLAGVEHSHEEMPEGRGTALVWRIDYGDAQRADTTPGGDHMARRSVRIEGTK